MSLSQLDTLGKNFRTKKEGRRRGPRWLYPVDGILLGDTWWRYESRHVPSGIAKSGERSYGRVLSFRDVLGGGYLTKCLTNILEMVTERGPLKAARVKQVHLGVDKPAVDLNGPL